MSRQGTQWLCRSSWPVGIGISSVCLAVGLPLLSSCSSKVRRDEDPTHENARVVVFERAQDADVPPGLNNLTSSPDPAEPGPFRVCTHIYSFEGSDAITQSGTFFVPALSVSHGRCVTHGRFPVLVITNADGPHGGYAGLGEHLASNAIIVAVVNRGLSVQAEEFEPFLLDHVDYIYNDSEVKDFVRKDLALLGHSAGGRAVLHHAGAIETLNLPVLGELGDIETKAVILLASTVDADFEKTFAGETPALMGMNVTNDSDPVAFGNKSPGQVMQSTFRIYDEAGLIPGIPNQFSLEKDMIFVNGGGSHYFQNAAFAKAYINAFLQLHLRGHGTFRRFFKQQEEMPPPLGDSFPSIFQQHAEPAQLLLANFEDGSADEHELGGAIQASGAHIENVVVGDAHQLDDFSPHHTKVMKFDWTLGDGGAVTPGGAGPDLIRFEFDEPLDLQPYRYVSFRITQVFAPATNPSGISRNISVRLETQGGSATVPVSQHGGELHFPIVVGDSPVVALDGQTKNAMRTYVIPLRAFEGIDQSAIDELVLDFSDPQGESTVFLFDDVAFWF